MLRYLTAFAALSLTSAASAQSPGFGLQEIRLGVAAHDLTDHSEDGPQIVGDLMFASPDFLDPIWSPRPFLSANISTQGYTNLVTAGLAWDYGVTDRLSLEASFGLSYNDGVLEVYPDRDGPVEAQRIKDTRALLGSDWLFRTGFAADYALNDHWSLGVFYEHHSHGQILASGRNQGLDELGLRMSYRLR
ncbi:acyloxyacyl hydrolase [Oceanicaulis alexandrii]|uniref:acyloxyacyl hydrolase n=1 Tax=Oceanicaulis alexandrii TaxID=153233 RepID=UPI002355157B|nr:acyloxyacyl hydrolase [Oceanicaulis alexandrii]